MADSVEKKSTSNLTNYQSPNRINVFDDIEKMLEGFSSRGWFRPITWDWPLKSELKNTLSTTIPDVDVIERDGEIIVKANMPGVDKKDIEVSLTKDRVTIKGKIHHEEKEEKGDYYRSEITKGSYVRTLTLPAIINEDKAKAKYMDGVLELTLPKTEVARRKNVKID